MKGMLLAGSLILAPQDPSSSSAAPIGCFGPEVRSSGQAVEELIQQALRLQQASCGIPGRAEAERLLRRALVQRGPVEHRAWALRALADLRVAEGRDLREVDAFLADVQTRDGHYAWRHAEAWVRYRQARFAESAALLEHLVSGRLHHTAWPWAMFHDDLGDAYAALGRIEEARTQWRRALSVSASRGRWANPPGLAWDRDAVVRKLSNSDQQR
jgi:tetratricopeptide (TPR) repeat protein